MKKRGLVTHVSEAAVRLPRSIHPAAWMASQRPRRRTIRSSSRGRRIVSRRTSGLSGLGDTPARAGVTAAIAARAVSVPVAAR